MTMIRKEIGRTASHRQNGFSLIELMIAMLLGLIVIAGATSAFMASKQTYRTNQALIDVQQNARVAFELMARDIRQAGETGCDISGDIANVLRNGPKGTGADWWADWSNDNVVHGYDDDETDPAVTTGTSTTGFRVSETDSLQMILTSGSGWSVKEHHATDSPPSFDLNESSTDLEAGDIIVVCDQNHMAILQISDSEDGADATSNAKLTYKANQGTPGNCSTGLDYPTSCDGSTGNVHEFSQNSHIAKLSAVDWYVGINPEGGHSLYRVALVNNSGSIEEETQEMVRGVAEEDDKDEDDDPNYGIELKYLTSGDSEFELAENDPDWGSVTAVRVKLTLKTLDERAGVDSKVIKRTFTAITTIRNRVD